MKRRVFLTLILLSLFVTSLVAESSFLDLGVSSEFTVVDQALADAQTNSASSVTVISQKEIESSHAKTTTELIGSASGVSFSSYGAIGAAESVQIRGVSASKTLVYMDGVLLNSSQDGVFDLSTIPLTIIERIEIVKNGPGNLGKSNGIGGVIHIITKDPKNKENSYLLSFENSSYIPQKYGSEDRVNYLALVDGQKLNFTSQNRIGSLSLLNSVSALLAQNKYTYKEGASVDIRNNANGYKIQDNLTLSATISDDMEFSSANVVSYQDVRVPGSLGWVTPNDYQRDLYLSSINTLKMREVTPLIANLTLRAHYAYKQLFYHDEIFGNSDHKNHMVNLSADQRWNFTENFELQSGISANFAFLQSNDVGDHERITPSLWATGSWYVGEGNLSIHPSLNLSYVSDTNSFSPNGSLGAIYALTANQEVRATISYAENFPSFNQLYWPGMSNAYLETEKGVTFDIGYQITTSALAYEAEIFTKYVFNAIANDSFWIPQNIEESFYVGTEHSVVWNITDAFSLSGSYLFNKSFDLSDGSTLSDNIEVANIRKHSAKGALTYKTSTFSTTVEAEYLGKRDSSDSAFLMNGQVDLTLNKDLKIYVAIENLLNTSYQIYSGYPMPGTQVRIGGSWEFK